MYGSVFVRVVLYNRAIMTLFDGNGRLIGSGRVKNVNILEMHVGFDQWHRCTMIIRVVDNDGDLSLLHSGGLC